MGPLGVERAPATRVGANRFESMNVIAVRRIGAVSPDTLSRLKLTLGADSRAQSPQFG